VPGQETVPSACESSAIDAKNKPAKMRNAVTEIIFIIYNPLSYSNIFILLLTLNSIILLYPGLMVDNIGGRFPFLVDSRFTSK